MKKTNLTLFYFLFFSVGLFAQDGIINSNRPGFSVSPYNVGKGSFQIEGGLNFKNKTIDNLGNIKHASNQTYLLDLSLRYALNNKLEFFIENKHFDIYNDIENLSINDNDNNNLLATPVLGASYRLNNGEGWMPTIALRGGLLYQQIGGTAYGDIDFTIATQNYLANNWVVITNLNVSKPLYGTELSYVVSLINTLNKDWSWFVENMGKSALRDDHYYNITNAGVAYLINDKLQLDFIGGYGTNFDEYNSIYLAVGVSWKIGE